MRHKRCTGVSARRDSDARSEGVLVGGGAILRRSAGSRTDDLGHRRIIQVHIQEVACIQRWSDRNIVLDELPGGGWLEVCAVLDAVESGLHRQADRRVARGVAGHAPSSSMRHLDNY